MVGVGLLVMGNGLQGTLVGVRAGLEGMSEEMVGVVMSAYFVGLVLGSVYAPRLVEQAGHVRAFAALASIVSAVALCFAIFVSSPIWMVLRLVHGACYAGLLIIVESWLNASSSRERRGQVLATYMVVVYAGWAISQPLLNLAPVDGFVLFCLVSVCLSLSLVPITLVGARPPGVVTASRLGLRELSQVSPLAVVGAFMTGLAVSAFFGMGPTFAQSIGMESGGTSSFLAIMLVGALALQWPIGWISDRTDRRLIMVACAAAAGVLALLAVPAQGSLPMLLAVSFLLGGASMPLYSICVAHANDHVEQDQVIATASEMILIYGIGSAMGPLSASLAMARFGPSGLFAFMGVAFGLFALFSIYRITQQSAPTEADKQSYVAVPQTSHAALPLHLHGTGEAKGESAPR